MSDIVKIIAKNKRASFDFFIEQTYEAGIILKGSEVKSIRQGKISLQDSHAVINSGEAFLHNCYIAPYEHANRFNHLSRVPRKLLLHKREIKKIIGKTKIKGYTIIPLSMFLNKKNILKVELGLAKGKKLFDKRQTIKDKEWERNKDRELRIK